MNTEPTTSTKYFTQEDVENFRDYATATTPQDKAMIYNRKLFKFIDFQIVVVMDWLNGDGSKDIIENYEDIKQDLHIHVLTKVLPVIDVKKVQAVQNLLHISIKNALIDILRHMNSKYKIQMDNNEYNFDDCDLMDEDTRTTDDVIQLITDRIWKLKAQQPNTTCVSYKYLTHLENYIIDNDYNAAGFKEYCMDKMNIGNSRFMNLSHSFGFKTIAFKKEKNKE